jgi:hypothetical protein
MNRVDSKDVSQHPELLEQIKKLPRYMQEKLGVSLPITVDLDDWMRQTDKLMFDFYDAKRRGETTMNEAEIRAIIETLTTEYVLVRSAEIYECQMKL